MFVEKWVILEKVMKPKKIKDYHFGNFEQKKSLKLKNAFSVMLIENDFFANAICHPAKTLIFLRSRINFIFQT